jgi:NAD(P)-dependent dehydrogenase (short-subunit alcohol dehydrogenase family)
MRVRGKIALVTGGAGGIGSATARLLAREGATVIITDLSDRVEEVAHDFGGLGIRHDVSSLASWETVVEHVIEMHGRVDVLAHCAGIEGSFTTGGCETTEEQWNRVIAVNLTGTFFACKSVVPAMLKQGTGSVILLSSIVSYMATSYGIPYGVSKAGVQQLTRSFAVIGSKNGARVRCNSVHPGAIRTRMTDNIYSELAQANKTTVADMENVLKSKIPFGDRGEPDDIANLVLYLASDESRYVTGSDFKADGGWLLVDAG